MDTETMESMWHEILNEQNGKTETIEKEPNNRQKITSPADI